MRIVPATSVAGPWSVRPVAVRSPAAPMAAATAVRPVRRDEAVVSAAGRQALAEEEAGQEARSPTETEEATTRSKATGPTDPSGDPLAPDELALLRELERRDREVRAHEQAHVAAGGGLVTRGASYSFRTGPDGQRYAVGGEVGIDAGPAQDPERTIAKMRQVRAAALAPAQPSAQDRRVAAQATATAAAARAELVQQQAEETSAQGDDEDEDDATGTSEGSTASDLREDADPVPASA